LFTFGRTEAEGTGNIYSETSLVNFVLAGISTSSNSTYETAVQLYNLERESGKVFSLKDLERKFFSIDKNKVGPKAFHMLR